MIFCDYVCGFASVIHIIKIHDSSHLFRRSELCLNSKRLSGLPYILLTIAARKQIAVLGWKMLAASLISRQGRKWTRIGGSLVQHMLSHAFSIFLYQYHQCNDKSSEDIDCLQQGISTRDLTRSILAERDSNPHNRANMG